MKYIQRLLNKVISYKIIMILLIIAFCCLLFPMLLIGKYNVPSADDFTYSLPIHDAIQNKEGITLIIHHIIEQTNSFYNSWQGLISSIIFWCIQPAVWGEQYYGIVPYLMAAVLTIGIIMFCNQFFCSFSNNVTESLIISIIILVAATQFLPSPVEGFYWYAGSVCYTFFFGISLILYAIMIRLLKPSDKVLFYEIFTCILCVIIGFSNFITALITGIIIISLVIVLCIQKNSRCLIRMIPPLLFFGISFYINISAPGNTVRQSGVSVRTDIFGAIWLSLQYAVTQLYQWNTIPVLAFYLFLVPVLWKIAVNSEYSFRMPWLVSLYSFGLQAAMNCPTYYAYMDPGPGRVEDIRFYAMVILIIINLFYWEGWLAKKLAVSAVQNKNGLKLSFLAGVILLCAGGLVLSEKEQPITSISAFQSYRSGEAGLYKHVFKQRLEILNDPEIRDAKLRDFPKKPYVLFFDDITTDPNDWRNTAMSSYYHKDSVQLMTHEEFEQSIK